MSETIRYALLRAFAVVMWIVAWPMLIFFCVWPKENGTVSQRALAVSWLVQGLWSSVLLGIIRFLLA